MTYIETRKRVFLGDEDRARVNRLTEEIQGRLEELAALGCRVLDIPLTAEMKRQFVRSDDAATASAADSPGTFDAAPAPSHYVEFLTTPTNPPIPVTVTYYDDGTVSVAYGPFTP
jgi:hypothetical protein